MYNCVYHISINSNECQIFLFVAMETKTTKKKNIIEQSNSDDLEETVTQSSLVTQSDNVDAQHKIFVTLILP